MEGLSQEEFERYDRQLRIPYFGVDAQMKLKKSAVMVAGVGGLGSSAAIFLAAAGVGKLRIVDCGEVELSNLNRQILYSTEDIGRPKVFAALERLRAINPNVEIEAIKEEITEDNIEELLNGVNLVVDGQDNFETRFIINKACVRAFKPCIHGAVYAFEGRLMTIIPGKGPCLRCLIPQDPKEMASIPILGPLPGIVGAFEALEAIKLLTGVGDPLSGKLLIIDGETFSFYKIEIKKNPSCPVCGNVK
ncbi:MAG: HesA/MoeB/ThiF family protein [Nitrososphaerota archaeon]|nr:HesA/MoeB/ThiF family protein [Nitrososphaerota archaeon]